MAVRLESETSARNGVSLTNKIGILHLVEKGVSEYIQLRLQ